MIEIEPPIVQFKASDNAFANMFPLYLEMLLQMGATNEQIDATKKQLDAVSNWRRNHPDKCKTPSCDQKTYNPK